MFKSFLTLILIINFSAINAQQHLVTGYVYEQGDTTRTPLAGSSVYWENSSTGTVTNDEGYFSILHKPENAILVVSYLGFKTAKITSGFQQPLKVLLVSEDASKLDEVVISQKLKPLQRAIFSSRNVTTIGSDELLKAACCNLSESFETNPSIDINYADALTGTKQIQMLGLTSPYILFTEENIPSLRGSNQTFGLTFTPGTWVESIQITKGAGTVTSGYESISGQINTELIKPLTAPPLFVNGYHSVNGRTELNIQSKHQFSSKWATTLFLHGNQRTMKTDQNNDGFLDMPLSKQLNLLNRWQYIDPEKGWVGFASLRYLTDEKQIGQLDFDPKKHQFGNSVWGGDLKINKWDIALKTGYVSPEIPYRSIGFQTAVSRHNQEGYFGNNTYDVTYTSFFHHLVYQSILGNTLHKFKTGMQYMADMYDETVLGTEIQRNETNIGGFFEYSYDSQEQFNMILGVRMDHHNTLGSFVTPRIHLRYALNENKTIFRLSAGEGRRVSSIFAEHQKFLGSQRVLYVAQPTKPMYGFLPERAWNYGFSWIQKASLFNQPVEMSLDAYRTQFTNRVVVDWETPGAISFYNLEGKSYAQSLQFSASTNFSERVDLRFAYKAYDIKTTYRLGMKRVPLQPKTRWFAFLGYGSEIKAGKQWRADATFHRVGQQRLVATFDSPSKMADGFSLLSSQLTRQFLDNFSVYVGAENLFDVKQTDAVLGAATPFDASFDTSQVYAPIFGRMIYAGFRFNL
ncbi:MAG: TonB-dependent receptor [Gammaproteobacteria bacterium]|nr:TonB-dependent receptor [Gammaproteobacteria bacterium]